MWKMVLTCLFWCLQKEMNDRNFEDRERTMGDLFLYSLKLCIFEQWCMCFLY
jgi:hypothetical protein